MSNNNYLIIMAGGVGTRLWPHSRKHKPKQFQDLLHNGTTLIQATVKRFDGICPIENVYVVTNKEYLQLVRAQIPNMPEQNILLEPTMKNTAPCIAYAAYKISKQNPNANIVVAPSDHSILSVSTFQQVIRTGIAAAEKEDILVTLGIKPNRPDTGYGYIQIEDGINLMSISKVKTFTEKPDLETAIRFYESDEFVWNSGMFIWNVKTIIKSFEQNLPDIAESFSGLMDAYFAEDEQEKVDEVYYLCDNISIDYGIMEKAQNVYVIPCDIGWSDLGTWKSLYEILPKDKNNNVLHGDILTTNSQNNIIKAPKGQLMVIDGLDNYIVVENEGVLVICHKDREQHIKAMVNEVKATRDAKFT